MTKSKAKQISVTIPDGLFERLQAVKDRFNVSGMCQEAIKNEVYRQELLLKGTDKLENVIERLKEEKQNFTMQFYNDGFEDGCNYARKLEYAALIEIATGNVYEMHQSGVLEVWETEVLKELWKDMLEEKTDELKVRKNHFDLDQYLSGWLDGVINFWHQIESKL